MACRLQLGDGARRCGDIQVERVALAVDQHRYRPKVGHHFRGGGEGERRHQHDIAALAASGLECQVQRRRARAEGNRVLGADQSGELRFELAALVAGGEPAGPHHGVDGGDLFFADIGTVERNPVAQGCLRCGSVPSPADWGKYPPLSCSSHPPLSLRAPFLVLVIMAGLVRRSDSSNPVLRNRTNLRSWWEVALVADMFG